MLGKKRYIAELSAKSKENGSRFVKVSNAITDLKLPPAAFRVLVCLLSHREDFHPSRKLIKSATGMSLGTIDSALKTLQRQKIVEVVLVEGMRPNYTLNPAVVWKPYLKPRANRPQSLKEGKKKWPSYNQIYNTEYKKIHDLTKDYRVQEITNVLDNVEKMAHWSALVRIACMVDPNSRQKFIGVLGAFVDHGLLYLKSDDVPAMLLREQIAADPDKAPDVATVEHLCPTASNLSDYLVQCILESPLSMAVGTWTKMFGLLHSLQSDPASLNCVDVFADRATQKAMLTDAASLGVAGRLREASNVFSRARQSRKEAVPHLENTLIFLRGGRVLNNVVSMSNRSEAT